MPSVTESPFGAFNRCRPPARAIPTRRRRRSPAGPAISAAADTTTLIVGGALCAPGSRAPLGPTAIRIAGGRIAAIEPVAPDRLDSTTAGLIALPAPTNAHDHGRG